MKESPPPVAARASRLLAHAALLASLLACACGRSRPLRHLPLIDAEMVNIGVEARPARRVAHDHAVTWTIPASSEATLELACAIAEDDPEPDSSAVFRVYRQDAGARRLLRTLNARRSEAAGWIEADIPWEAHRDPATLTVEVESRYRGEPVTNPAISQALVAEPALLPKDAAPSGTANLVLFLVDTLRADRLGCYGGPAATPEIDRLAREGLRVERTLSTSSWTLPAHASLFTSTSVARHRAGDAGQVLGPELPTLAERLKARGFRTLAVTNGLFVDPAYGVARGFDRYITVDIEKEEVRQSIERAIALVRRYSSHPWFLFFHTYQVHQYRASLGCTPAEPAQDRAAFAETLRREYDRQTALTDAALGDLRRALAAERLERHTAIVFTSDHGEVLDDRPEESPQPVFGHRHPYLHDEELRIPLVLYDPSREGGVIPGPVSIVDIAPAALEILGQPPEPSFEGVTITRSPPEERSRDRLFAAECPPAHALALEKGGRKLILRPLLPLWDWTAGSDYPWLVPIEAYQMARDPEERSNRATHATFFQDLRREAHWVVAEHFPGSLIVRVPAALHPLEFRLAAASGLRAAGFYRAKPEDRLEIAPDWMGAEGWVAPGSSDTWIVIEPRRPLDGVRIVLSRDPRVAVLLGGGEPLPAGETRVRWKALLRGSGAIPAQAVLVTAFSLAPGPERPAPGPKRGPEMVARLRALGYIAMPESEAGETSPQAKEMPSDEQPAPRSAGPDVVVIELRDGPL